MCNVNYIDYEMQSNLQLLGFPLTSFNPDSAHTQKRCLLVLTAKKYTWQPRVSK